MATAKLAVSAMPLCASMAFACAGDSPSSATSTEVTTESTTDAASSTSSIATADMTSGNGTDAWATADSTTRSESSTGPELPGEDELPLALAIRMCAIIQACECPNYDPAKCVTELELRFADWQMQAIAADFAFDAACWATALELLDAGECGAIHRLECPLYHGDAQDGESCERFGPWMTGCAPPLWCPFDGGECLSIGDEPTVLDRGEACYDHDAGDQLGVCDPAQSLECDFETAVCVALPAVGLPCERGDCVSGAWCDALDDDGPVCKLKLPPGAPCVVAEACMSSLCVEGTCLDLLDQRCFLLPPWEF